MIFESHLIHELQLQWTPELCWVLSEFIFSGVTVLLSLTVFQQSISDAMPVTSLQIPLLGKITDDMD